MGAGHAVVTPPHEQALQHLYEALITLTLCRSEGLKTEPWKYLILVKCRLNSACNSRSGSVLCREREREKNQDAYHALTHTQI